MHTLPRTKHHYSEDNKSLKANSYSFVVIVLFCFLPLLGCASKIQPPAAKAGVLDLSGWDFEKNGMVRLGGEWEFYWHRLLTDDLRKRLRLRLGRRATGVQT